MQEKEVFFCRFSHFSKEKVASLDCFSYFCSDKGLFRKGKALIFYLLFIHLNFKFYEKTITHFVGGANLPLVSILLFFIALLPGEAWAETYTDDSGTALDYEVNGDEVYISNCWEIPTDHNLVIPGEIEGKPVTRIARLAFNYQSELVSVKFPASVTTIEEYAFEGCESLAQISFEENCKITTIKEYAFNGTSITEITIPKSVTLIGEFAIHSYELTKVTFLSNTPCKMGSQVFGASPSDGLSIIVPAGTSKAYKSATGWSDYAQYIKEAEPTSIRNSQVATSATHAAIYSLDGKKVSKDGSTAGLAKGIYIQNGKKVVIGK